MPLEFHEDALILSGVTGTLIKTSVIAKYYEFWQSIVSGGELHNFKLPSTIIDMNAGTSEIYIKRIDHKTFGSAGHALHMKYNPEKRKDVDHLTIILIEESSDCLKRLIKVILRRWPHIELMKATTDEYHYYYSKDMSLFIFDDFKRIPLEAFKGRTLGNCLLFFDPLRATDWNILENIAFQRIDRPYREGTEFIVFLFTSDWIRGRHNFSPLPLTSDENLWSMAQKRTVKEAEIIFGDSDWLKFLKPGKKDEELENNLVEYYSKRLHRFFRFVIPLPFSPKKTERYDLFFCTNYLIGANGICDFYYNTFQEFFGKNFLNTQYLKEKSIFLKFKELYPDILQLKRKWKILWSFLHTYPDRILDQFERSLREITLVKPNDIAQILKWLEEKGFIKQIHSDKWVWSNHDKFPQYIANWEIIEKKLEVEKPKRFHPIDPETLKRTVIEIYDKRDWPKELLEELEMKEEWDARRAELLTLQGEPIEKKKDCALKSHYCDHLECPIDDYNESGSKGVFCPGGLAYFRPACDICEDCEYHTEYEDLSPNDESVLFPICGFLEATLEDDDEEEW